MALCVCPDDIIPYIISYFVCDTVGQEGLIIVPCRAFSHVVSKRQNRQDYRCLAMVDPWGSFRKMNSRNTPGNLLVGEMDHHPTLEARMRSCMTQPRSLSGDRFAWIICTGQPAQKKSVLSKNGSGLRLPIPNNWDKSRCTTCII